MKEKTNKFLNEVDIITSEIKEEYTKRKLSQELEYSFYNGIYFSTEGFITGTYNGETITVKKEEPDIGEINHILYTLSSNMTYTENGEYIEYIDKSYVVRQVLTTKSQLDENYKITEIEKIYDKENNLLDKIIKECPKRKSNQRRR